MNWQDRLRGLGILVGNGARWLAGDLRGHWPAALFSVAAAFIIWFIIEDITNPREEGRAPADSGIQVTAVNVPDGYLVSIPQTVFVTVQARESDIATLRPDDFRATVDLADVDPTVGSVNVPVQVTSRRDNVDVLEVSPPTVNVHLERAFRREVEVTARMIAPPPPGFRIKQVNGVEIPPDIEPPIVTIEGPEELVARVERVEIDVNLATARTATFSVQGDLVARSEAGNEIQLSISDTRATATFQIESVVSPTTLGIRGQTTGTPAKGFAIVNVTVDPPTVEVTGPQAVIEGLKGPLLVEPVDVSNARQDVTQTRTLEPPENVSVEVETVVVTVEIAPIPSRIAIWTEVTVEDVPPGLIAIPGALPSVRATEVVISGDQADIDAVREDPTLIRATVSLSGAQAGTASYTPTVTVPPGVNVESRTDVTITLAAGPP